MRYGWSGWRDGSALRFYLSESAPVARWPWLSRLVTGSPALCRLAAWGTLVIELGSVAAVFSHQARLPLILCWVGLHLGILCMMMPAYWVQMWCYLLLLDWPRLVSLVTGGEPGHPAVPEGGAGAMTLAVLGCLTAAALVYILVTESEQWPFTSVPMYSNGTRSADRIVLPGRAELHSRAVRAARGRHGAWQRPWVDQEYMEDIWALPADDGARPQRLFHLLHERGATPPCAGRSTPRWCVRSPSRTSRPNPRTGRSTPRHRNTRPPAFSARSCPWSGTRCPAGSSTGLWN
ncbi:hypothetical protein ACFQ2B_35490 [Streptomyces stramineus]